MALTHQLVTLNASTPVLLTIAPSSEIEYAESLTISIQNLHASRFIFIGSSSVSTSSYGFRIDPGQTFTAVLNPEDEIYGVTDTSTANAGVIRIQH